MYTSIFILALQANCTCMNLSDEHQRRDFVTHGERSKCRHTVRVCVCVLYSMAIWPLAG